MLRAELRDLSNTAWLRVQDRFTGAYAEQTRVLVLRCNTLLLNLVVDLSEVMFVDAGGEDVLLWLARIGTQFVANSPRSLVLCARLRLPILKRSRPKAGGRILKRRY